MTPELFLRRFEHHGRKHNPMESQFAVGIPIIHEWIRLCSQQTVSQDDLDRLLAQFTWDRHPIYGSPNVGSQIADLYFHVRAWGRELGLSVPRRDPWLPTRAWPKWLDVLEVWNGVRPPDVEIIPFVIGTHRPDWPWFNRRAPYVTMPTSPQVTTAHHLLRRLSAVAPECLIAYKIYASCRERDAHHFNYDVIEPVFEAHGLRGTMFWTVAAKYVLPVVPQRVFLIPAGDEEVQLAGWRELVTDAAEHWTAVANEWALVRIPDFMDRSSVEYAEWRRFASEQETSRERTEYERLKRKFAK